jgi:hypothetical protein
MRRTKLVLAALALMVAMLVAFSAPAMADKGDHHGKKNNNGDHKSSTVSTTKTSTDSTPIGISLLISSMTIANGSSNRGGSLDSGAGNGGGGSSTANHRCR